MPTGGRGGGGSPGRQNPSPPSGDTLERLIDALRDQTAAISAAVSSATPTTVSLDATAVAALAAPRRPTEMNGQRVRPADFDRSAPDPPDDTFTLPAEPKNPVDHGQITKNESHLMERT